jgi:hypothetical protein
MSGNTPPEQNDKSPNDIVISQVKPKSNLKLRREGKFTPKTLKKQNDNLGIPDDKEETQINLLKEKIDEIFKMVSGDFAASIDKVLQLIENLKKQLKDKDNKCAECSKLINDAEIELNNLKTTATHTDSRTNKLIAEANDDVVQTELMVQENEKDVNSEENNLLNNIKNEFKEQELNLKNEYNKDLEYYNDIQELINKKNVSTPEIVGISARLKHDIEIKNILNILNSKLQIITREVTSIIDIISRTRNKKAQLRTLFIHLTRLSLVLKTFTEYTTNLNSTTISSNKDITKIINNNKKFFKSIKNINFKTEIPPLDKKYYDNILNLNDIFVKLYENYIPTLKNNIKNNNDKLKHLLSKKTGGSHNKRNKTNKIKKRKSKKLKGKMCKKNKTIKRKH